MGENIAEARKKAGLKQSQLAEILGVAVVTIGQYERGKRQPRLEQVERIAEALNTTVSALVGLNPLVETPKNRAALDAASRMTFNAGITIKDENGEIILQGDGQPWTKVFPPPTEKERLDAAFDNLNPTGRSVAVERVEELTKIPDYQKQKTPPEPE